MYIDIDKKYIYRACGSVEVNVALTEPPLAGDICICLYIDIHINR